ncbi:putative Alpha-tubulin suppressor protein Aats1 [Taphrina deformans PYCC 5710]|uniref:Alpha-tubulin suppressor protein Aats1 n=1 Tax=Taphrina deformans (strain PYCC 5710 / ATCC 11124 / CBS 356.35 / IMI 108563 / JCM 9778 / NBRC 8474) TaxID=1097556 RepID=R4XD38_TAPDE|nr:putative Alpha-tubulin suppressor protein Aats1 [Taphrina deformans PYCC 5710]|eukprot:CCG82323.1 putative Alpha-tubulin suppressor protein Aats1 [Taphrina deformans PYCC 5710]
MTRLFSLGSNGNHQLSLGHNEDTSEPSRCILAASPLPGSSEKWTLTSGGNHTLLLTDSGAVFATGSNEHGQLGLPPTTESVPHFTRVHPSHQWTRVACGFDFSVLVDARGGIFVAGLNDKGALGLGSLDHTESLQEVPFNLSRRVTHLAASINHVVMVLNDNEVYGWGNGRQGALGPIMLDTKGHVRSPTRLDLVPHDDVVRDIAVGKDWTIVLTSSDARYVGMQGRRVIDVSGIDVLRVLYMTSNWSTVHFLMDTGTVEARGRDDRGQFPPPDLPPLKSLASGSEHSIGIGRDGRVYVWGWNEHGNCGKGTADVEDVRVLDVPIPTVTGVAGGYGTTFIW